GAEILVQLLHAADPDDRSRHPRVAERPRERHLRERLAALARDVAQRPDRLEVLVDLVREERIALRRPRALRDAARVPIGELTLGERAEDDAAGTDLVERV